jgi:hypothetical protein
MPGDERKERRGPRVPSPRESEWQRAIVAPCLCCSYPVPGGGPAGARCGGAVRVPGPFRAPPVHPREHGSGMGTAASGRIYLCPEKYSIVPDSAKVGGKDNVATWIECAPTTPYLLVRVAVRVVLYEVPQRGRPDGTADTTRRGRGVQTPRCRRPHFLPRPPHGSARRDGWHFPACAYPLLPPEAHPRAGQG